MDIYSQIFTRASTTKFDATSLDREVLERIEKFIADVKPLVPDVEISHKTLLRDDVKGLALPNAPHFIIISGKEHPMRNVCAGFLYQHAELYLYSIGLAARWLNSAKEKKKNPDNILGIAFGKPMGPASRKHEEFNRKPLGEIAKGSDSRLEAARLAPSGMNAQPWYYIADGAAIHAYYKKSLGGLLGVMYDKTDLDLGISLCHLAVASEHEGKRFRFVTGRKDAPEAPKGFEYIGTVE